MFTGTVRADLLLGDVHSLKHKRAVVRPIVSEVSRRTSVAVAETGHLDLYRRAEIGAAVVAPDAARCQEVLDQVERMIAERPEVELTSCQRRLYSSED